MNAININEEENQYFRNLLKLLGNNDEVPRFSKELQRYISYKDGNKKKFFLKTISIPNVSNEWAQCIEIDRHKNNDLQMVLSRW